MKTAFVFGERSKMGLSLLENWPSLRRLSLDEFLKTGCDYLFLTGNKQESLKFLHEHKEKTGQILDFSGATKFLALAKEPDYHYAVCEPSDSKILSFPGCAAWGIIHTLLAFKKHLPSKIYASVNFPQSALGRNSKHKNSAFIHPLEHLQEKEINSYFKNPSLVSFCSNITQNETGLTFSLMFSAKEDYKETLKNNLGDELILCERAHEVIPKENKVLVHVAQKDEVVCIIGAVNNLVGKKFSKFIKI